MAHVMMFLRTFLSVNIDKNGFNKKNARIDGGDSNVIMQIRSLCS